MERREFLKQMSVGLGALAGLPFAVKGLYPLFKEKKVMPKRPLGETGVQLSIIGLGGVTVRDMPQAEVNSLVHQAIDSGINYIDVAPAYGNAEELLGPALKGYRDKVFLACKTGQRKKEEAAAELRQSLKKLGTAYFDLYQFLGLSRMEDVETIFGESGALEAFLEGREQGLIRYIGFSAHSVKAALAALDRFDFDTILFPVNFVLYFKENFGPQVIEKAKAKGVARLAIKAMAKSQWPEGANRDEFPKNWYLPVSDPKEADMALRFTLSQPITAAIPPGDERLFRLAMKIAANFTPIQDEEIKELKRIAQDQVPIFKLDV